MCELINRTGSKYEIRTVGKILPVSWPIPLKPIADRLVLPAMSRCHVLILSLPAKGTNDSTFIDDFTTMTQLSQNYDLNKVRTHHLTFENTQAWDAFYRAQISSNRFPFQIDVLMIIAHGSSTVRAHANNLISLTTVRLSACAVVVDSHLAVHQMQTRISDDSQRTKFTAVRTVSGQLLAVTIIRWNCFAGYESWYRR